MATSLMDKGVYAAPTGIASLEDAPELEIEIENPDSVTMSDGSMEITLVPEDMADEGAFDENLAEQMDEGELGAIASELIGLVDADMAARKDWSDMYVKGIEVLGLKYEDRTEPWDGACGVFSTVLTEAVIRFQAETMELSQPACRQRSLSDDRQSQCTDQPFTGTQSICAQRFHLDCDTV